VNVNIDFSNGYRIFAICNVCEDVIFSKTDGEYTTCSCKRSSINQWDIGYLRIEGEVRMVGSKFLCDPNKVGDKEED